jgi:nitrite reductase/ring-hydroxylating ferredoxin subunit
MELDWQPNRVFDDSGQWLLCATHGAAYQPATGECAGGPCKRGLVKIELSEAAGVVHWHEAWNVKTLTF